MKKRAVISIAGMLGSGKSTTSRAIARELKFDHFSAGDWQKKMADSMGLTLEKYHELIEHDATFDRKADDALVAAGKKGGIVIDSRLGFHFIPDSFKVFLLLEPRIAAERMMRDAEENPMRHKEILGGMKDADQVIQSIKARVESEGKRYFTYYGVTDHMNPLYFDLAINTGTNSTEATVATILEAYKIWIHT